MTTVNGLTEVFLKPGDLYVGDAGHQLRTILGSCVSITLWHPMTRTGGMSHFLLPTRGAAAHGQPLDARYGDEALQLMIKQLAQSGVAPSQCKAKIFGGGNMFPGQMREGAINVGKRNGEAARAMLNEHGIPILSESLFGIGHRQVIFVVNTGDVWSNQIMPSDLMSD